MAKNYEITTVDDFISTVSYYRDIPFPLSIELTYSGDAPIILIIDFGKIQERMEYWEWNDGIF